MQLRIALQRQAGGCRYKLLVHTAFLGIRVDGIDGRNDFVRQRMLHFSHQVHRSRALSQQVPVQRRHKSTLKRRLVLDILDYQVRAHLKNMPNHFALTISRPYDRGGDLHTPTAKCIGFFLPTPALL
ncbi:hypothetical protein D9M70_615010 [compost metagenome]